MTMLAEPPAATSAPISIREYFSQQSDLYSKTDAKTIGPELERLAADGKTKLRDVVDAARPDDSPLHRYFEWDDHRAAEGFRQLQAGRMTRAICVYTVAGGQERSEPAFRPVTVKVVASQQAAPITYVGAPPQGSAADVANTPAAPSAAPPPGAVAVADEDLTVATLGGQPQAIDLDQQVIERALISLEEWERKYRPRCSRVEFARIFRPVFEAISEAHRRAGGTI